MCGHDTLLVETDSKTPFAMVPRHVPHFAQSNISSIPLLKVQKEYLAMLINGDKVWELRSTSVNRRGRVDLGIDGLSYGTAVLL